LTLKSGTPLSPSLGPPDTVESARRAPSARFTTSAALVRDRISARLLRERRDDVAQQSVLGTVAVAVRRQHLPANALDEPLDHAGDDDIARERRAPPRPRRR